MLKNKTHTAAHHCKTLQLKIIHKLKIRNEISRQIKINKLILRHQRGKNRGHRY